MQIMQNLANRLQLRDFRLVQAIADTGQLALAAERLAMTQPAASRMLAGWKADRTSRSSSAIPKA
jgi:hypothetical protein